MPSSTGLSRGDLQKTVVITTLYCAEQHQEASVTTTKRWGKERKEKCRPLCIIENTSVVVTQTMAILLLL
jgi:hypothetical protein